MNMYLMSVFRFFSPRETFVIEAENKEDAVRKGKIYVRQNPKFSFGGNYDLNDVKCVKKMKAKKGALKDE